MTSGSKSTCQPGNYPQSSSGCSPAAASKSRKCCALSIAASAWCFLVAEDSVDDVCEALTEADEPVYRLGRVIE